MLVAARSYFELAHSYTRVFPQPALVLVAGLTGTGEFTVAQELARREMPSTLRTSPAAPAMLCCNRQNSIFRWGIR